MNLYGSLGLQRDANAQQIREAYKNLVRTEHPDKGGNAEKFKEIQKAYDVLRDDAKKSFYDQTGQIQGEDSGGGGNPFGGMHGGMPFGFGGMPMDMGNMFNMFNNGSPKKKRAGKAPPRVTQISLNMKDFYQGRNFRIQLERQKFCGPCKGEGSTSMKSCAGCNGSGKRIQMIQMGPFVMQNEGPCEMCRGQGKQKGDSCWTCKGSAFIKEEKFFEIRIEQGMAPGNTIVFSGESSDTPDYAEAGDVVIELQAADETIPWQRKGNDLHANVSVSYSESLVGCSITISGHPGYETGVVFPIVAGVINGEQLKFSGYGMPKKGTGTKGDAVLTVSVNKPTENEREVLLKSRDVFNGLFSIVPRTQLDADHKV